MKSRQLLAIYALFLVTALWGLTFPLIKQALADVSPAEFVVLRFLFSIILFLPIMIRYRAACTLAIVWAGFVFGSLEAACYFSQSMGLKTITSAQSAFITALSVVIAPLLAPLFGLAKPHKRHLLASACCLLGIFILTQAAYTGLHIGVLWTLLCALFYALSVNYLSYVTAKIQATALFVGLQVVFGLPLPFAYWLMQSHAMITFHHWHQITYIALCFCAVTTVISYYLQTKFQRRLAVGQFMMIYACEPLFAAIFGALINHERITWHVMLGGCIIISGLWIASRQPVQCLESTSAG